MLIHVEENSVTVNITFPRSITAEGDSGDQFAITTSAGFTVQSVSLRQWKVASLSSLDAAGIARGVSVD
jgi:hypothetical protein